MDLISKPFYQSKTQRRLLENLARTVVTEGLQESRFLAFQRVAESEFEF